MDKSMNFCDHSIILWEMTGDLLTDGFLRVKNDKHFIQVFVLFILEFEFTSYTWDVGFLPGVFFSSFVFIYVTIQDRGDIIGYYYSTLGNSFVPCFSCRKQQENNMFVFLVTKQLQKTTTLFSCRKHKKQQEWNRRSQPMFKSISVWLLRLKKWKDIKQKREIWKALVVGVYHGVCLQNKISSDLNLGPLISSWSKITIEKSFPTRIPVGIF